MLRRAGSCCRRRRGGAVRFPRQVIDLFTAAIHLRNEYLRGPGDGGGVAVARDDFEERLLRW